jgi:hypothetical protein
MAATLSQAFITKWSDDVTHLASQKKSKLMDAIRVHRNVGSKTYNFQRMGNMSAVVRPDGSYDEVIPGTPPVSTVSAVLQNYEAAIYIPKFDEDKINYDSRVEYQTESVETINRTIDDVVISALGGATATANTYATLTLAAVQAQAFYLDSSDVEEEDRIFLAGMQQKQDLLGIQQFTDIFYLGSAMMGNTPITKGTPEPVLGFGRWVFSTRLPVSGTNRTCYAFAKYGVGAAIGQDLETTFDWVPARRSWLVVSDVSLASVIVDQARVTPLTVQSG